MTTFVMLTPLYSLTDPIISALIAAAVSLAVALIGFFSTRKSLSNQVHLLERQLAHKYVEKAYDLRIKHYAQAFAITENICKGYDRPVAKIIAENQSARDKLVAWRNSEVMLVISDFSLERAYELEQALGKKSDGPNAFSDQQIKKLWKLRRNFRGALRRDLGLFQDEDR